MPDDAPVALCEWHLAVASEWENRLHGVTDVLPSPCPLCGSRLGVRYASGWLCAVCEWRYGEVVDTDLPPPRVDVVYYLRYDDRIKIGTSANPRQRLAALEGEQLIVPERGDRTVERHRHEQFAADRFARTEWFRRSSALEAHVAGLAAGVVDPWLQHARWVSEAVARSL